MQKIPVAEAIGIALCHDITKIVPGIEKTRAFKRGHVITAEDVEELKNLGKEYVYVWEDTENLMHEDEAALRLARSAAGPGLSWTEPNQGKVSILAEYSGLLMTQAHRFQGINHIEGIVLASLHGGRAVQSGATVAGARIIPLAIDRDKLEQAERLCAAGGPVLSVRPFRPLKAGIVTTGNEVYQGRIQDGFGAVIRRKIAPFDADLLRQVIVPDDPGVIAREIDRLIQDGAELVFVTGGMSVDPDDVTPVGIKNTGAQVVFYGVPVLPGAMLMLAYKGPAAICGIPGCVMFNGVTSLDLILPYIFAGEKLTRDWATGLGHGGLCRECESCHYPDCSFGKTI
jgi:hypothetical protein